MDPAFSIWEFKETDSGTVATWGFGMENLNYPMGRYFGVLLRNNMLPYLKKGLENIKTIIESMPKEPEGSIGTILEKDVEAQTIITVSDSVTSTDFQDFFARVYPRVSQLTITDTSLKITGAPFAIFHSWDPEGKSFVEAGFPVNKKHKVTDEMVCRELLVISCVYVSFYGPYELSGMAHDSINAYINEKGYMITGPPMEIYITDPAVEPDPSKWETQVLYPIGKQE
jgi:effector-binding domain-containing protein